MFFLQTFHHGISGHTAQPSEKRRLFVVCVQRCPGPVCPQCFIHDSTVGVFRDFNIIGLLQFTDVSVAKPCDVKNLSRKEVSFMSELLDKLKDINARLAKFETMAELLYWDMRTIMPEGGFEAHADAMDYVQTEAFRLSNSDELYDILKGLSETDEWNQLDDDWQFIVKTMREDQEPHSR